MLNAFNVMLFSTERILLHFLIIALVLQATMISLLIYTAKNVMIFA